MSVVRRIRLPRPLPHQREILLSSARFKVVCAGRRFGKTLLGLVAVVAGHGPMRADGTPRFRGAVHGAGGYWVAPTYGIAAKIWRDLKHALRDWGGDLAKNEVERRIDFPGGGWIAVKSAHNPDALRGDGLDFVVVDEAAFVPEEAWTLSMRATLADKQGWAIFISTPSGRNWFHTLYESAPKTDGWAAWTRPTAANPTIAPAELRAARDSLGSAAFAREFEASFDVGATGFVARHAIQYYDALPEIPYRYASADLAISTASHGDFTVAAAFGRGLDGRLYLLDVLRERILGARVVEALQAFVDRWGARWLVLEGGGPLQVLNAQAKAVGLSVIELPHRNRDKEVRAQPLAAALQQGRLLFPRQAPWLAELINELVSFPSLGVHDDQVDALALGVAAWQPFKLEERRRQAAAPSRPMTLEESIDHFARLDYDDSRAGVEDFGRDLEREMR